VSSPPSPHSAPPRPLAVKLNTWWRAATVALGLAGLGAGGAAVFITHVEAGPVALLIVGLVLLLIGIGGRMPTRIKAGDYEAAWEAVQEFVGRVADDVPGQARPEMVDALGNLADAAPQAAAAGLSAIAYHDLVISMLQDIVSSGGTGNANVIINLTDDRIVDAVASSSERRIAIEIKSYPGNLNFSALLAFSLMLNADAWQTSTPISGLLISRTPLSIEARNELYKYPSIYVALVRGPHHRAVLEAALRAALGSGGGEHYFWD
jgi:hypothetical protein